MSNEETGGFPPLPWAGRNALQSVPEATAASDRKTQQPRLFLINDVSYRLPIFLPIYGTHLDEWVIMQ
jgi:hypothetical protein